MNRDHDVKRPRLGYSPAASSTQLSPPHISASALHLSHHPPQHSGTPSTTTVPAPVSASGSLVSYPTHSEPASTVGALPTHSTPTSANHPYQTHSIQPLGSQTLPPPGHPASAPPFVAHPPPGESRPGYGDLERHQPRGFPGPPQTRPPTTLPHSPTDRRQSAPSGAPPAGAVIMEPQSHQHSGVFSHPMEGGHPGNAAPSVHGPNGMHPPPYQPAPPPAEQFQPPVPPSYNPPGSITPYAGSPYHPQPISGWASASSRSSTSKKHQRAQIACNNCRARKQKCDEQTPSCSYCLQEKMPCEYRHVAPPKVDKNIVAIQDKQKIHDEKIEKMGSDISLILDILKRRYDPLTNGTPASLPPPDVPVPDSEMVDKVHVPEQPPGSHSTGAQHLFKTFPKVQEWFRAAGVANENYPYELERKRGVLRLFGSGWSGDDPKHNPGEVATYDDGQDVDSLYPPRFVDPPPHYHNKGGLNPNGTLRLDASTVRRLHDSYVRNMWAIYPIFHAEDLKQRVQNFITKYSPNEPKPQTPPIPNSPRGQKRSYSQLDEGLDRGYSGPPKRAVDHSLSNAIILLVLAIGKLCEHEDYLMSDELKDFHDPFPGDASTSHGSSPNFARPSPSRSTTSSASPKFPDNIMHTSVADYPTERHMQVDSRFDRWNVLRYPGLAYYIEAVQILGECSGSRNLEATQANILAGLYWGQIGCVLQSAHFIHIAANTIVELLYQFDPEDIYGWSRELEKERWARLPEEERNEIKLFLIIFWSALQIEGDILAELERLPSSRLPNLAERNGTGLSVPDTVIGVAGTVHQLFRSNLDVQEIIPHFLNQYTLRKLLNRAHLALYGTAEEKRQARQMASENSLNRSWADLSANELWEILTQWRTNLQAFLSWKDSDQPASNILHARLRAKYYGAAYMINRVFLKQAVSSPQDVSLNYDALKTQNLDDLKESTSDIGVGCRRCILSALKSTIAFDTVFSRHGRIKRAQLPNVFGTFTAQFSNMLVVASAFLHERLHQLVPDEFIHHLRRTIQILHNLSPVSPVFDVNKRILMKAYEAVMLASTSRGIKLEYVPDYRAMAATTWSTPQPQYGSPGVQSTGGRSSVGPGTPRYHEAMSAGTSFSAPR